MRRWTQAGLLATVAFAGLGVLASPVRAEPEDGPGVATTPKLPIELLDCIARQLPVTDQVRMSQACHMWQTGTKRALESSLAVVRTQKQLDTALAREEVATIVVIPDESVKIETTPVNPQTSIIIYDTRPKETRHKVIVMGYVRVTASGTAKVWARYSNQIVAHGNAKVVVDASGPVVASGNTTVKVTMGDDDVPVWVTASGNATVWVDSQSRVKASGNAAVVVRTADSFVKGKGPSVRIWADSDTQTAVRLAPADAHRLKVLSENVLWSLTPETIAADVW